MAQADITEQTKRRGRCELPAAVAEAVLGHAERPDPRLTVTREQANRFSTAVFVAVESPEGLRRYVVKLRHEDDRQSEWSPKEEYRRWRSLWELSRSNEVLNVPEPIAWGDDPPYLVTAFVDGTPCETLVKAGCRRLAPDARRTAAVDACRRMGEWVQEKYRATERTAQPYEFEEYRAFCAARLDEIARFFGRRSMPLVAAGRRWLSGIGAGESPAESFPIVVEHGEQYDCTPQNFMLTEDRRAWGIDFETYRPSPLQVDPCYFRFWLEGMLNNLRYSREALAECWSAFAGSAIVNESLLVPSYAHTALAHLAWCRNPEHTANASAPLTTRVSEYLWARSRGPFLRHVFEEPNVLNVQALLRERL